MGIITIPGHHTGGVAGRAIPPIPQEVAMSPKTKAAVAPAAPFDPFKGSVQCFDNSTFVLVAQGEK
jgi:hypothetical protein